MRRDTFWWGDQMLARCVTTPYSIQYRMHTGIAVTTEIRRLLPQSESYGHVFQWRGKESTEGPASALVQGTPEARANPTATIVHSIFVFSRSQVSIPSL